MRKKCLPGTFCVENMTFMLVVILGIMVVYLYYVYFVKNAGGENREYRRPAYRQQHHISLDHIQPEYTSPTITVPISSQVSLSSPMNDPYIPPLKNDIGIVSIPGRIPVNIKTNSVDLPYSQVGILTRNDKGTMILPLMGRGLWNGRDKWQYYTMSNTAGALNTKLPISVNGRSCTGEYGCDSISNGDTVYVEGYNDTFRATIYENSVLRYLPI